MKKTMLTVLSLLLVVVMALALVACSEKPADNNANTSKVGANDPKTDVSIYKAEGFEKSQLKNQVSWDGINAFPIKKADMPIDEARKICVDFFNYAKTATWIPNDNYGIWSDATIHTDGSEPDRHMDGGMTYGGLPYISWATGNIYRLMDYIDPNTGVVDMAKAGDVPLAFGNQCANGAYVGFSRVINSAKYGVTATMVVADGFLRLGNYTYSDAQVQRYSEEYGTPHIVKENGTDVMYESYALLKPADGLVNWTTAGHVMMAISEAHVEYLDEAKTKIDGNKSYVYITDQHVQFSNYTHPDGGDQCLASNYINRKFTFQQLLSSSYLPFTFPEWTGDDKIEQTECGMNVGSTVYAKGVVEEDENRTFKNTAENVPATITASQLFKAKITSNYYIMDLYFQVYNADGVEVYKLASRPIKDAGVKEFQFFKAGDSKEEWGSLDVLDPTKEYTVKISAQLGTGERPVVWEGKLAWDK